MIAEGGSGLDLGQVKALIVTPVLEMLGLPGDSTARGQLMAGIGLKESGYRTKWQDGGPALGFWQMEPATHDSLWADFLRYQYRLAPIARAFLPARYNGVPAGNSQAMVEDDFYACACAALRFFWSPQAVPHAGDALGMAQAWKTGYNTDLGAGMVDSSTLALFQAAINA